MSQAKFYIRIKCALGCVCVCFPVESGFELELLGSLIRLMIFVGVIILSLSSVEMVFCI